MTKDFDQFFRDKCRRHNCTPWCCNWGCCKHRHDDRKDKCHDKQDDCHDHRQDDRKDRCHDKQDDCHDCRHDHRKDKCGDNWPWK